MKDESAREELKVAAGQMRDVARALEQLLHMIQCHLPPGPGDIALMEELIENIRHPRGSALP